jgi:hypothetical protein
MTDHGVGRSLQKIFRIRLHFCSPIPVKIKSDLMHSCLNKSVLSLALLLGIASSSVSGQKVVANDTNYYERYPDHLTTRLYLSQKFLKFTIPSKSLDDVEYKANTKLNLGMGITYHNISLNVFYGFAFLNKDTAKGETKGLDLQLHLYPRRWAIDLIALFPKGYYLFPKGYAAPANRYYYRPDIRVRLLGVSAYQVPNKERFSYRAAITQNEWQKKSAGSPLYGGMLYNGAVSGDSALVPKAIENGFAQKRINDINFTGIGAGVGYAYTLVIKKHFFITASAVGNVNLTITSEDGELGKHRKTTVGPSVVAKAALGYNSATWNISINSLGNALWSKGDASTQQYYLPCGAIRMVVSRKFNVKKSSAKK